MEYFDLSSWHEVLQYALENQVSDIHISAEQPVFLRQYGKLKKVMEEKMLTDADLEEILSRMLSVNRIKDFEMRREIDFSWEYKQRRFRVNAYYQRNHIALALRLMPKDIPDLIQLGCPQRLKAIAGSEHGLLLVTGKTGSGKTTTLASLLNYMNQTRVAHIITLEDPIEYIHSSQNCLIDQREFGSDFLSFSKALRSSLREDPDVLLIGEIRDQETMLTALHAAETGHFVLGSLHTQSADEAAMRIESMFPAEQQAQIRAQLAVVLTGIFSQRLLLGTSGKPVCAAEFLLTTPAIRNIIRTGKYHQLKSHILSGTSLGMQTLEMCLEELCCKNAITRDTVNACLALF